MRGIIIYIVFILFITVLMPITLVKGCDRVPDDDQRIERAEERELIDVYNVKTKKVEKMEFEEYIKQVVAAEMPAEFHIEALKAQAVAARTYALERLERFKGGHPDHPDAPLCTAIHCQAWLSKDDLRSAHGQSWMYDYWPKIEDAVDGTAGQVLEYDGKLI